jgi:hypothetical protein
LFLFFSGKNVDVFVGLKGRSGRLAIDLHDPAAPETLPGMPSQGQALSHAGKQGCFHVFKHWQGKQKQ